MLSSFFLRPSLCANINRLDARCEDLQRCLDETRLIVETSERKNKSSNQNFSSNTEKKLSHSGKSNMFFFLTLFDIKNIYGTRRLEGITN